MSARCVGVFQYFKTRQFVGLILISVAAGLIAWLVLLIAGFHFFEVWFFVNFVGAFVESIALILWAILAGRTGKFPPSLDE